MLENSEKSLKNDLDRARVLENGLSARYIHHAVLMGFLWRNDLIIVF